MKITVDTQRITAPLSSVARYAGEKLRIGTLPRLAPHHLRRDYWTALFRDQGFDEEDSHFAALIITTTLAGKNDE